MSRSLDSRGASVKAIVDFHPGDTFQAAPSAFTARLFEPFRQLLRECWSIAIAYRHAWQKEPTCLRSNKALIGDASSLKASRPDPLYGLSANSAATVRV